MFTPLFFCISAQFVLSNQLPEQGEIKCMAPESVRDRQRVLHYWKYIVF